jgi:arylsulfatase B
MSVSRLMPRGRISRAAAAASLLVLASVGVIAASPTTEHGGAPARSVPRQSRPNVLIIVADDLGFADVGFNGGAMPTPNIDRIARMGTRLDHFYVSAVCSPSRAGLLTGRYPHRYGIMGDTITPGSDFGLDPQERTIAQVLGSAGYERRSFLGKWHLGHRSPAYHPMSFGFTSFYGHYNGAIDYFTHEREGQPDWHRDRQPANVQGYSTDLLTDEAVRILGTPAPGGKPWLMWLAYNAPHGPLQAKPEDLAALGFDPAKPRFASHPAARESAGYGEQGRGNTRRQTALAMIRALDRGVGRVLDALTASGQLDNTVILFTSDNGGPGQSGAEDNPSSNGPLRGWKFLHYDGGVRVAAAIAWPGHLRPRPTANVGAIAYVDVLPTIAHLAGASLPRPVDGEDVSGALLSGHRLPRRAIFLGEDYRVPAAEGERGPTDPESLRGRTLSVVVGKWKLVGDQLFDIEADPDERANVAADHRDVVARLKRRAVAFAALRQVPRARMNATHLPPIPLWELTTRAR